MDRRAAAALIGLSLAGAALVALVLRNAWSVDDFDLPEPPDPGLLEHDAPRDPRVPPDFDLTLPPDSVVRYGESNASRATVLYTTDAPAELALTRARDLLEARGWTIRVRDGSSRPPALWREAIDALDGARPMGSAVVERGGAEITRVHLSLSLEAGTPFHAPDEPREWRRVDRPPLPARPGGADQDCMRALRTVCADQAEVGGPAAVECAMDHRGSCGFADDVGFVGRVAADAEGRLLAALEAHARVGSRAARAQTQAQLRVELLGARASLARANNFEGVGETSPSVTLAVLVAQTEAEGTTLEVDTSAWFHTEEDSEIQADDAP